jgi:competence ComEA-like helix-hairpin-helix protein
MKQWLQSLQLSPAERNGSIVLMLLIVAMLGIRLCLMLWQPTLPVNNFAAYHQEIAAFEADTLVELNTANIESLVELPGIGPSMAEKIITYRVEIGGFSYIEQLMEIPGIGEAKVNGLIPYVSIDTSLVKILIKKPDDDFKEDTTKKETITSDTLSLWPIKLKSGETLELNGAKIEDLQRLPGIGLTFAQRIYDYRTRLGGFYAVEQLKEVAGLGEAKYVVLQPYLSLNPNKVQKLNINYATEQELLAHPYCKASWVAAVLANRPFTNLQQLPQFNFDTRLVSYLTIGD